MGKMDKHTVRGMRPTLLGTHRQQYRQSIISFKKQNNSSRMASCNRGNHRGKDT